MTLAQARLYRAELHRDPDSRRGDEDDEGDVAGEADADARPVKITSLAQLRELEDAARARAPSA